MEPTVYVWLLLVGLSTSALGYPTHNSHNDTSLAASKLNPSLAQFTLNLYKQLSSASPGKNIFFSPISIAATLSALSLGARSTTRTQILEGLSFNISEIQEKEIHEGFHDLAFNLSCASDQIQMDLGQALFLRENVTFKQTFLDDVHAFYEADITSAKFQKPKEAEKQINDYVARKTHGKITQLVKDLGPDTTLVAINYIFFKGNWKIPFNPKRTTERDFFVDEKTAIKVPMMYQEGWFDIYFDRKRSCTVLRLEYNDSASAFFVLPERGKDKQLEDVLTLDTLTEWQGRLYCDVGHIYIPKFEISTCYKLKEALHNLHITDVFSDSADLSGITEEISLKVTKVIHKAFVSIDERGATASAATAAVVFPQYSDVEAEFNRPFLLFIVDSRNTILFFGKIANPERNEAGANSSPATPE